MAPVKLLTAVALAMIVAATSAFAGVAARAQVPTAVSDDCEGAEEWLEAYWELNLRAAAALQRFMIEVRAGEPFEPQVFTAIADDLNAVVQIQSAGSPPSAAVTMNEMLLERWTLYAEAMEFFAQYAATGDEDLGMQATDRTGRTRQLGERLIGIAEAFKVECGLSEHSAFLTPACYQLDATRWFNLSSVRMTEFLDVVDTALDRLELGLPVDELLVEMEDLRDEQVRSLVPDGAEEYQLLILDYYVASIAGVRAWAAGDQDELDRLVKEVTQLEQELLDEETDFMAPCTY